MKPAVEPRRSHATRLLVLGDAPSPVRHSRVDALGQYLDPGDLLVVNRSGTVPASLQGRVARTGESLEVRLGSYLGPTSADLKNWMAIFFGAGDWTHPTEKRGVPPVVPPGEKIVFGPDLTARVVHVDLEFPRLVQLELLAPNVPRELYRHGRPLQYSYMRRPLQIHEQQTLFAGPAVSVEPPSAAFPLTWDQLLRLEDDGIEVAALTHAAGISSSGDAALDERLPLPEWFDVPEATAHAIQRARDEGRRVVALGTTVARATESAVQNGIVVPGAGLTRLKIGPDRPPQVVDALVTGMHDQGSSHLDLMRAFTDTLLIERGYAEAEEKGYLAHEYGDLALLA